MVDFEIWNPIGRKAEQLIVSDNGDFEIWNAQGRSATQMSTDGGSSPVEGNTRSDREKVFFILRRRR